jgi:NAD(P) transhydrogenase subunit alpha
MNPASFTDQAQNVVHILPPEAGTFIYLLTIFLMACFVGYYVVWNVTPALHSPLMAVTNGISSVIIVGAMLATGLSHGFWPHLFGFLAVTLAA